MHGFLTNNRDDLIARCQHKAAQRPHRDATARQLADGVPMFLDQLIRTLVAEEGGELTKSLAISGSSGGDADTLSEIGIAASAHGAELLALGYSVDQVVHDYGDLCQAITDLAVERDAPFSIDSYRTLNRCLDNAIADAVSGFADLRDAVVAREQLAAENQRLGFLVHELRNHLHVAALSFSAIESGRLSIAGSTGAMLKRSLQRLDELITQTVAEVRDFRLPPSPPNVFSLAGFISDAEVVASLFAKGSGCTLWVPAVDPQVLIRGNRELLSAALNNLLQNAFKFTAPRTQVSMRAHAVGDRVFIEVRDHCGGLPPGAAAKMFTPFTQVGNDRRGLGLGLSIAAQSVKASGGVLSVRDLPGLGCAFTIDLPAEPSARPQA